MPMNFRQIKAIENANKGRILKVCPTADENSGIYIMKRIDEQGFKFCYVGQAKHLLTRLSQHLSGYQHIDLSLKKHGLYDEIKNPFGWQIGCIWCNVIELDKEEQRYIKLYANAGYQMRNATSGSQGEGKKVLDNGKPTKGYMQGLAKGYLNARKDIAHLFDFHLTVATKKEPPTKNQEKALQKFNDFLDWENKA